MSSERRLGKQKDDVIEELSQRRIELKAAVEAVENDVKELSLLDRITEAESNAEAVQKIREKLHEFDQKVGTF